MNRVWVNISGMASLILIAGLLAVTACVTCQGDCPKFPYSLEP